MTQFRYPMSALAGDYARAGAGLVITAGPLALIPLNSIVALLLGAAALIFGIFLARTVQRQMTVVETSDEGIAARGPRGAALAWADLHDLKLSYYSTRRDRAHGWMHLWLRGRSGQLRLESTLDGFDDIVERAAQAARSNGVSLTPTTLNNLAALGVAGATESGESDDGSWATQLSKNNNDDGSRAE